MPEKATPEDIRQDIQRVAEKLGKVPTRREYGEHGEYSTITPREKFGSWTEAREAAGLTGGPTKNTYVSESEIVDDIQRVADEIGESPSQRQYNERGEFTHQAAVSRFDSWNTALEEVGLATEYDEKLPKEKLLQDIHQVGEDVGHAPSQTDYRERGEHGVSTVQRRFESWSEAVRKAGFKPNQPGANPGERNGYWKGGYEPYYGPNWHEQRRKARERDNYRCQDCGMSEKEHQDRYGWGLEVHHITPKREFEDLESANSLDNLITLCRRHHRKYEFLPGERAKELIE